MRKKKKSIRSMVSQNNLGVRSRLKERLVRVGRGSEKKSKKTRGLTRYYVTCHKKLKKKKTSRVLGIGEGCKQEGGRKLKEPRNAVMLHVLIKKKQPKKIGVKGSKKREG